VRSIELAWAAGFYDGEGCTSLLKAKRDKYHYIRMGISQKETTTLQRFLSAVGAGKIYKANTREINSWNLYKKEDVITVLNKLWPYLSEPKKQQALTCFHNLEGNEYEHIS